MGKSGKERKRRRLEAGVLSTTHNAAASDDDHDDNDAAGDESNNSWSRSSSSAPLGAASISNAINCLREVVSKMHVHAVLDGDVDISNIWTKAGAEQKVLRKALYPLIQRQKDKHFDVPEKEESCSIRYDTARAIRTFQALQDNTSYFDSAAVKELRRALHPLVLLQRVAEGHKRTSMTLSGEVALAFNSKDWHQALVKLLEMKRVGDRPKLGALQRWVRQSDGTGCKSLSILLLSLIIRLSDKGSWSASEEALWQRLVRDTVSGSAGALEGRILYLPPFRAPRHFAIDNTVHLQGGIPAFDRSKCPVLEIVKGPERRPPNELDLVIYVSTPGTIQFDDRFESPDKCTCHRGGEGQACDANASDILMGDNKRYCSECLPIYRSEVPGVNGALLLSNVLTSRECKQFINMAEAFGYVKDAAEGIEAFVMMGDDALLGPIFDRCKHLLPQVTPDGKPLKCINPRLRFFRYSEGAEYHPHIDGSWTLGGSDSSYYSEGKDATEHSYMTFLIYLNGGFDGGGTTFFVPPSDELRSADVNASSSNTDDYDHGGGDTTQASFTPIVAQSVEPVEGSILCFPHGVVEGSLVHEGSAVKSGVKYVIRSDLMFTVA